MSGPDVATRADGHDAAARERVSVLHAFSPWWRVVDAETLWPPMNAECAVAALYIREGAK